MATMLVAAMTMIMMVKATKIRVMAMTKMI